MEQMMVRLLAEMKEEITARLEAITQVVQDITPKLQDVIATAKPNLGDAQSRESEELLIEYGDSFAVKIDDYGQIRE
jgi:prefoldin subunit 5